MFGLLMCRRRFCCPIGFYQHKSRRLVRLLKHVESRDAWLLHTLAGVCNRRSFERLNRFWLDPHMNMDDEHPIQRFNILTLQRFNIFGIFKILRLVESRLYERLQVRAIAGFFHLFDRNETQRS